MMVAAPNPKHVDAIRDVMKGSPLVISNAQKNYLKKTIKITEDALLVYLAAAVAEHAVAPLSSFSVGAAGTTPSGNIYLGVNLEFTKTSQSHNVHAEQFVMTNLAVAKERALKTIAIVSYRNKNWKKPMGAMCCGICRQFLTEANGFKKTRILTPGIKAETLTNVFKFPFQAKDLGNLESLLEFRPQKKLKPTDGDRLFQKACDAYAMSYTPKMYSGANPSGVALETSSGQVFSGFFIENVSYIASLSPLQVALVQMHTQKPEMPFSEIKNVALVENENAGVSQVDSVNALIKSISPTTKVRPYFV